MNSWYTTEAALKKYSTGGTVMQWSQHYVPNRKSALRIDPKNLFDIPIQIRDNSTTILNFDGYYLRTRKILPNLWKFDSFYPSSIPKCEKSTQSPFYAFHWNHLQNWSTFFQIYSQWKMLLMTAKVDPLQRSALLLQWHQPLFFLIIIVLACFSPQKSHGEWREALHPVQRFLEMRTYPPYFSNEVGNCLYFMANSVNVYGHFLKNFPCRRKFYLSLKITAFGVYSKVLVTTWACYFRILQPFSNKKPISSQNLTMLAETKNFVFLLTLEQSWMDRSRSFSILHLSDWN